MELDFELKLMARCGLCVRRGSDVVIGEINVVGIQCTNPFIG
jgi:hypothetical protein